MKIITEPTVTLLSIPLFFEHPRYRLPKKGLREIKKLSDVPDNTSIDENGLTDIINGTSSECLIATAGKTCYDSFAAGGRPISEHIHNLIEMSHGSVLEHANVSVLVEGISRGCSHELVRHRAGFAFSQRSTRYVNEEDCAIVLEPKMASCYEVENSVGRIIVLDFLNDCAAAIDKYIIAVQQWINECDPSKPATEKRKYARGKARQLLPHAIETRLVVTANLRAWRHFFEARSHRAAEGEIRRLSNHIYHVIQPLAPAVFDDYECNIVDGFIEFTTKNRKV